MQHTANLIRKFFENMQWPYHCEEDDTFSLELELEGDVPCMQYAVILNTTDYVVYGILPNKPEPEVMPRVAEFLHRANSFMPYCNFELDYKTREIRIKYSVDFELCKLSYAVVERSLTFPTQIVCMFSKGLLRTIYSNDNVEQIMKETGCTLWNA